MPIEPGLMDREITLKRRTKTQDASTGEEILTFTEETIWAQWLPGASREVFQAQQRLGSYVDGIFRIYDISPRPKPDGDRICFGGRTFDIKPYVEVGRGEGLDIPVVGSTD